MKQSVAEFYIPLQHIFARGEDAGEHLKITSAQDLSRRHPQAPKWLQLLYLFAHELCKSFVCIHNLVVLIHQQNANIDFVEHVG